LQFTPAAGIDQGENHSLFVFYTISNSNHFSLDYGLGILFTANTASYLPNDVSSEVLLLQAYYLSRRRFDCRKVKGRRKKLTGQ
jgi:hypothetical protein